MTYVAFADVEGATGTIAADWTIEYDGAFTETTNAVVSNMDRNGNASREDLQRLMLTLFKEGYLAEIELIDNTPRQESLRGQSRADRRQSGIQSEKELQRKLSRLFQAAYRNEVPIGPTWVCRYEDAPDLEIMVFELAHLQD
ncbi:hypothetical protein HAPAU_42170 [Halalkalicoccus paucihalophilus]|uniref:Uncharacterized protein n=1 Tax=Halalkalicoccus paucihalophilus TaxID=1008153 RepID=A0A151A8M6_9EURY|nr:hypothetical protein [Halalkalicoccus paucihalophilus]KYH23737.1 hypothetical protein HAPAU_42170 [Halalkalicoccus paucihalophilus]